MAEGSVESRSASDKSPQPQKSGCLRRLVKACVCLVLLLVAVFLGVGALLPASYEVRRSIEIDAGPEAIYPYVADFREWPNWSTWTTDNHPGLRFEYSGAETGQGAVETWYDPDMGEGRMEISSADQQHGIAYELRFEGVDAPLFGDMSFEPAGEGRTRVVWTGKGDLAWPTWRWMGLALDSMVGADYDAGLAGLKQLVEEQPAVGE